MFGPPVINPCSPDRFSGCRTEADFQNRVGQNDLNFRANPVLLDPITPAFKPIILPATPKPLDFLHVRDKPWEPGPINPERDRLITPEPLPPLLKIY